MTIGIYGGTFDPIHQGHLLVADNVVRSGAVDSVWLVVNRLNPLKAGRLTPVGYADRLEMARLATAGHNGLQVSDIESRLPVPSYTIDTLRALAAEFPEHDFRIVIGSDNLGDFERWKDYRAILEDFGALVYPRPGYPATELLPGMQLLEDVPEDDASSTQIRGGDLADLPAEVARYICTHGLYGGAK